MNGAAARYDAADAAFIASGDWHAHATATASMPSGERPRILDGAALGQVDTNGAWLLLHAARWQPGTPLPELRSFRPEHSALMDLVARYGAASAALPAPPRDNLFSLIGRGTLAIAGHFSGLINFIGRLSMVLARLAGHPGQWRWREFSAQLHAVFVGAIPIVFGMLFLLGVVFAYLLGSQAQQYGANIFVVDGLLLAILREISPVIVAVLVAGRTGAAITAQLGTMKVTEEVDAIATLGLSPFAVLVVPRVLALLIAMPLLVFVGDVAGVLGGMLVTQQQLDIAYPMFVDRAADVLSLKTLMVGIWKAPVFAIFIALIACRMGLSVSRDARSVGSNTTSTVVQSLVAIIILNAIFAVMFVRLGI